MQTQMRLFRRVRLTFAMSRGAPATGPRCRLHCELAGPLQLEKSASHALRNLSECEMLSREKVILAAHVDDTKEIVLWQLGRLARSDRPSRR
jgi:hypothetical protein